MALYSPDNLYISGLKQADSVQDCSAWKMSAELIRNSCVRGVKIRIYKGLSPICQRTTITLKKVTPSWHSSGDDAAQFSSELTSYHTIGFHRTLDLHNRVQAGPDSLQITHHPGPQPKASQRAPGRAGAPSSPACRQ